MQAVPGNQWSFKGAYVPLISGSGPFVTRPRAPISGSGPFGHPRWSKPSFPSVAGCCQLHTLQRKASCIALGCIWCRSCSVKTLIHDTREISKWSLGRIQEAKKWVAPHCKFLKGEYGKYFLLAPPEIIHTVYSNTYNPMEPVHGCCFTFTDLLDETISHTITITHNMYMGYHISNDYVMLYPLIGAIADTPRRWGYGSWMSALVGRRWPRRAQVFTRNHGAWGIWVVSPNFRSSWQYGSFVKAVDLTAVDTNGLVQQWTLDLHWLLVASSLWEARRTIEYKIEPNKRTEEKTRRVFLYVGWSCVPHEMPWKHLWRGSSLIHPSGQMMIATSHDLTPKGS